MVYEAFGPGRVLGAALSNTSKQPALKKRASLAVLFLGARSGLQVLIRIPATIYLARTLTPTDFGVFAMLQFAMSFLRVVGDGGLGMALVQQQERPDQEQLSSVFWAQIGLAVILISLAFVGAPLFVKGFDLAGTVVNMLRAFSISLLFSLMRSIPMISMEREVKFGWVGTIEFLGSTANYLSACVGAFLGFGAMALVVGLVLETFTTMLICFLVTRWRPSFVFRWETVRSILPIGLSLQGKSLLSMVNDAVSPVLLGLGPGAAALGLVNFARTNGQSAVELIVLVRRVAFPYFSRLQDDKDVFVAEFHRAVSAAAAPSFFFIALFFTAGEPIVAKVFEQRWLPAVPPMLVFSAILGVKSFTWIGDAALDAIGDAHFALRLAALGVALTWVSTAGFMLLWPTLVGFALGAVLREPVTVVLMTWRLRTQGYDVKPLRATFPSAAAGLLVFAAGALIPSPWLQSTPALVAYVLLSALSFLAVVAALDPALRGVVMRRFFHTPR